MAIFFVASLALNTGTPLFDIKTHKILNEPCLEQALTGYDKTWPQHYGHPIAALDWSKDPFVALYFANQRVY